MYGRLIDPPAEIQTFKVHEAEVTEQAAIFEKVLKKTEIGEGFEVAHGQAADNPEILFFRISIWKLYRFYAIVAPKDF